MRVRRVAMSTDPARRAQDPLARVAVHHLRELLHGGPLLGVEVPRDLDHEAVVDVAAAGAAEARGTLAAQALDRPVLGAGRHAELLRRVEGRDLHLGALERLGDRDRHLDLQVVALGLEHQRLLDVRDDEEVARRAPAQPGVALAAQADARALLHAGRDVDPVALDLPQPALAAAGRAGVLDDGAGAAAARAWPGDGEHALTLRLDAAAVAHRADLGLRAGTRAGAAAGRARRVRGHRDGDLGALDGLLEGQADRGLEVVAALGRRLGAGAAPTGVEDARQDVRERAEVARRAGSPCAAAAGRPAPGPAAAEDRAAAVVLLALLGVAQDVVGLGDLLEALLGAGVLVRVRVVLARELAVRLLDLLLRRLAVDAEDLVVVRTARHRYPATTTRAGRSTAPLIR